MDAGFVGTTGGPPPSMFVSPPIDLGRDEGGVAYTFERIASMVPTFGFLPTGSGPIVHPAQSFFDFLLGTASAIGSIFRREPSTRQPSVVLEQEVLTFPTSPTGTDVQTTAPEVITIPPARIRSFNVPLIALPPGSAPGDGMPEYYGTGPGFDLADIFDIGGRILGDVNVPYGGFGNTFGGEPLRLVQTRANGANGGAQQVANGNCPPPRARMPSSIMADDPCSPTNPTIYIKAGKASAALWPAVIRSQAKRLSGANKSIPKKIVRRKKK